MPEEILRIIEATLTPLAAAALLAQALRWRRRGRMLCPGRRTRLWFLNPAPWFLRLGCRYDLVGLPADAAGLTTCPECGRRSTARQRVAPGRRIRVGSVAAAVLALGVFSISLHASRGRGWTRCIPTLALVALERTPPVLRPRPLREELWHRVSGGEIGPSLAGMLSRSLAENLKNDTRRGNACGAEWWLWSLWPASRPALEAALVSGDVQARVIAGRILRSKGVARPTEGLLRACIEDLRLPPPDLDYDVGLRRVSEASDFLLMHAGRAEDLLDGALGSDDPQQRLVAAGVAGFAGLERLLPRAAPVLVEHLGDNTVAGDANLAAPALFRFGPAAIPFLEPHLDDADEQRRGLVRSIVEVLRAPDRPVWRLENPPPLITERTDDPIRSLSLWAGVCDLSWPAERTR